MTRRAQQEPADACREYALNLLDRRAYTVLQLSRKLRTRQFPAEVIQQTLDDLERLGLVDDLAFAKAYTAEKTQKGAQPVGRRRIMAALRQKGVSSARIEEALRELDADETAPDEMARALAASERKWAQIERAGVPIHIARARLARFLFGRGFPPEVVRDAVDRTIDRPRE